MILIIGLGNPGEKYAQTRHNAGFRVVDEFAKKNNFPEFKLSKKFNTLISENIFSNEKIILAKPQTFMNNSGKAVKKLTETRSLLEQRAGLWVVHDDIDLLLGRIKIVENRGSAGHKGVESIIDELGTPKDSPCGDPTGQTKNFIRFRVGIQPKSGKPKKVEAFVLQKFNKEERKIIKEVIKTTTKAIEVVITQGLQTAMTKFNK